MTEPRKDLSKELAAQRSRNPVDDVSVEALKRGDARGAHKPVWNPLAEAYVEGCCEIHVHFRSGTVEGGIFGDWCALIKKAKRLLTCSAPIPSGTKNDRAERLFKVTTWGSRCLSMASSRLSCHKRSRRNPFPHLYGCSPSITVLVSGSMSLIMLLNFSNDLGLLAGSSWKIGKPEVSVTLLGNGPSARARASSKARLSRAARRLWMQSPAMGLRVAGGGLMTCAQMTFLPLSASNSVQNLCGRPSRQAARSAL